MGSLQDVADLLAKMTRPEKAQVLQCVVRNLGDAFPGIENSPDVCGGDACIVRTRIPVWLLEQARHNRGGAPHGLPHSEGRGSGQRVGIRTRAPAADRAEHRRERGCLRLGGTP